MKNKYTYILHEAKIPIKFLSHGRVQRTHSDLSHQACAGERGSSITKKYGGGSLLCARTDGRSRGHTAGLLNRFARG